MIVTDGKQEIMKWLAGESATAPTHVGFGDGTTSANASDTALESELDRKSISTTRSGQEVLFEATIPSTEQSGETISEIGLLNAASDGTLINRVTFNGIAKTTAFDIQIDITLRLL